MQALHIEDISPKDIGKMKICEDHFKPTDYITYGIKTGNRKRLKPCALPCINLPGKCDISTRGTFIDKKIM